MTNRACTGQYRVCAGKWTIPKGKKSEECTYCEWCVTNQCVELEPGFKVSYTLYNCSCDCPVKDSHAQIEPYNCGKHGGLFGMQAMGRCKSCFRDNSTASSVERYCPACSALYNICEVCGVDPQGHHPMRPVAKMLSAENGRGHNSDSDSV